MSDGFLDFSIGDGDDKVGKTAKRFKAGGGRTYRATFCWFSVKTEDGWDDELALDDEGKLHPDAQIRFTGCERVYKEGLGYFLYKGGGDFADTCLKISQLAETMNVPVQAIHVPKTVDNDLPVTDNCPGFGSVAKYIAVSTR